MHKIVDFISETNDHKENRQDSIAIAKKTARCAQYMGALKSFESSLRTRLLFQKFVMDFCSDRY